jgi:hypothetical protein
MDLNGMSYEQLEALSRVYSAKRKALKAEHTQVARRMDELAADAEAKRIAAKLSPAERAKLRAELAAEA